MRLVQLAALGFAHVLFLPNAIAQHFTATPDDTNNHSSGVLGHSYKWDHACPQLGPLLPKINEDLSSMDQYLNTREFFWSSVDRFARAVTIDTTSSDGMQELPGDHPAWSHMFAFSKFLEDAFPLIHLNLRLDRINTHGLVYTWHGRNESLKPILLLAHQDVVPVEPESEVEWKYPPFRGHFDGTYVWGRGSIDCKNTLISSMEAVEELIRYEFYPERTVILAFGFDEEISGYQGAQHIAAHLLEVYGEDGIALSIDEGPGIFHNPMLGSTYALPGVAEKGYFDADVVVHMKSGHSLSPPRDNSITVMADLVRKINDKPFEYMLDTANPSLNAIFCVGQNDEMLPEQYRNIIKQADKNITSFNGFLTKIAERQPLLKPLLQTTQSQAMIQGGIKVNVMPERTSLRINYRIVHGNTVDDVKHHLEQVVKEFIAEFNNGNGNQTGDTLTFIGWDENDIVNSISLRALPGSLEPSPITPSYSNGTTPYSVLQGTTRAVYPSLDTIAPMLFPAKTDSRHYGDVTKHIFRFSPGHDMEIGTDGQLDSHPHSVNERATMSGHITGVRWYSMFIRNMDEADMD